MKTKTYLRIIFSLLTLFNFSCRRDCDRTLEKFSQHEAFSYFAFEQGSDWFLSNEDSTVIVSNTIFGSDERAYSVIDFCKIISIDYSYSIEYSDTLPSFSKIYNESIFNKNNSPSIFIRQSDYEGSSGQPQGTEVSFDMNNKTLNNLYIELYFIPSLQVKGTTYNDVAIQSFNFNNGLIYVEKLYVAPNVGPVRVDINDGRIFELDSSTATPVSANYFE